MHWSYSLQHVTNNQLEANEDLAQNIDIFNKYYIIFKISKPNMKKKIKKSAKSGNQDLVTIKLTPFSKEMMIPPPRVLISQGSL